MWGCLTCLTCRRLWTDVTWIFNVFILHLDWGTAEYMYIYRESKNKQKNTPRTSLHHCCRCSGHPSSKLRLCSCQISAKDILLHFLHGWFHCEGKSYTLWRASVAFSWCCPPVIFKLLICNKSVGVNLPQSCLLWPYNILDESCHQINKLNNPDAWTECTSNKQYWRNSLQWKPLVLLVISIRGNAVNRGQLSANKDFPLNESVYFKCVTHCSLCVKGHSIAP